MQLIEIIQLTLLIFIALSVIIFLFSYLGYRKKSKIDNHPKPKIEERKLVAPKLEKDVELVEDSESVKQQKSVKQNPRFEVFTPSPDENKKIESDRSAAKKSHSPKTLIIKHKS